MKENLSKNYRTSLGIFLTAIALLLLADARSGQLQPIRLGPDHKSFVLGNSGKTFRVWGVNYDHDSKGKNGRLIEDYWDAEWQTVCEDFREMKDLGANVVRIHLQTSKFMTAADRPNLGALARLRQLLELAEQLGLYLDVTGLGGYHKADTPAWYDALGEAERWEVHARFWSAVAKTCSHSPAVFCYDLMNEPILDGKKDEGWVGGELAGKWYIQRLTLTPGKRTSTEIAKAWVEKITAAIRVEDREHLITVGDIAWSMVWPGAKPVFYSPEVSRTLDFVSIHLYPSQGQVEKALAAMAVYEIGKPLVIEETFPLNCDLKDMEEFLRRAKNRSQGCLSFYWGRTIAQYSKEAETNLHSAITGEWLRYFQQQAAFMQKP